MKDSLNIALAQLNFLVGDIEGNAQLIIDAALQARDEKSADVVVFTELSITGYPLEDLLFRSSLMKRVQSAVIKIQNEIKDIYVVLGAPTQENEQLFNSALIIYNSQVIATYHKHQLPNYEVFDEKRYFSQGNNACVASIKNVKVGITICEDIWFSEPIKKSRGAGAELVINLNASPYQLNKTQQRLEVLRQRISEQKIPIVYVNQIGGQDELVFDGESLCLNKEGKLCLQAPAFETGVFSAEYSKAKNDLIESESMHAQLPKHASIYQALVLGVKDYVEKNHFESVVLGLSGGIDSALTLTIAVDALGAENVHAVMMPFRYTSDISVEDAKLLAKSINVKLDEIPIEQSFSAITNSLEPLFAGMAADVTEENIQSRIRGVLLMAISNKTGSMLLTTGNKSEMSVGYATLYGDMAGGFAPLKDVSKTLVYELSKYRNSIAKVIPERIITRAPSAELAPDQIDEDSLPPYEILDPILEKFVELDFTLEEIVADGFDERIVRRVIQMVLRNEYKRRQSPPGIKITSRAYGKDRRYPITSGFLRNV
ncbi:MAG: NAD+ synthase [Gammaproteobacteria bacterium]|nr:NAD+ synthase [Gammaproteobacteria bacterium]